MGFQGLVPRLDQKVMSHGWVPSLRHKVDSQRCFPRICGYGNIAMSHGYEWFGTKVVCYGWVLRLGPKLGSLSLVPWLGSKKRF
jgi:hypothetical protein